MAGPLRDSSVLATGIMRQHSIFMPLPSHPKYPALVIDASGSSVFTGILASEQQWLAKAELSGAPLEMLFPAVEEVLQLAQLKLAQVRSFIYCEGPGSILGLRLCAMAIETWTHLYPDAAPCFAYNSLQLSAALLVKDVALPTHALLVSDWKKGAWNAVHITRGVISCTSVVEQAELEDWQSALYHLPQRKGWQTPPAQANSLQFAPERLHEVLNTTVRLRPTQGVELYSNGVNTFAKWNGQRHRMPANS